MHSTNEPSLDIFLEYRHPSLTTQTSTREIPTLPLISPKAASSMHAGPTARTSSRARKPTKVLIEAAESGDGGKETTALLSQHQLPEKISSPGRPKHPMSQKKQTQQIFSSLKETFDIRRKRNRGMIFFD
jgi:hypothetical protein